MTDTPIQPQTWPRPSRLDQFKGLFGDMARPFAIWATAFTTARAIIDPSVDSGKLTAAGLILVALYGAKALEIRHQGARAAKVEIAKATTPGATQ